ncbi:hypothetical protein [Porphyromonas crevioricanis]|uniref:Uncharacterized protein n=1 Tax=Porphyromonas crevioricanis TaxID=393921 RepID=A0A2X4PPF7_9PORP|nr:hypothetical protein [Porphyromonas crevioricanis]SQH73438.1 Uncharacterised protein [Porphyromonas crevioricanis]
MLTKTAVKLFLRRSFRFIFHRRGYGIHSPFVFRFITRLVEERTPYYTFPSLRAEYANTPPNWSFRELELIFRIVDQMHIRSCLLLAKDPSLVEKYVRAASSKIELEQVQHLDNSIEKKPSSGFFDLIVLEDLNLASDQASICDSLLSKSDEQMLVINLRSESCFSLWGHLLESPDISVSIDLGRIGMAFTHSRLHKRHYNAFI